MDKFDKAELAKKAAEMLSSIGVGAVVANTVKFSLPPRPSILTKISFGIGGFVLSNMVGDFAAKYVREQIEVGIASYQATKDAIVLTVQEQEL